MIAGGAAGANPHGLSLTCKLTDGDAMDLGTNSLKDFRRHVRGKPRPPDRGVGWAADRCTGPGLRDLARPPLAVAAGAIEFSPSRT